MDIIHLAEQGHSLPSKKFLLQFFHCPVTAWNSVQACLLAESSDKKKQNQEHHLHMSNLKQVLDKIRLPPAGLNPNWGLWVLTVILSLCTCLHYRATVAAFSMVTELSGLAWSYAARSFSAARGVFCWQKCIYIKSLAAQLYWLQGFILTHPFWHQNFVIQTSLLLSSTCMLPNTFNKRPLFHTINIRTHPITIPTHPYLMQPSLFNLINTMNYNGRDHRRSNRHKVHQSPLEGGTDPFCSYWHV